MSSSNEEGEIVEECVTKYTFVNSKGDPVSFANLPLKWSNNEGSSRFGKEDVEHAFLRGRMEGGHIRWIYRKAIAWKFGLSHVLPEIYVLLDAKHERWMKLLSPEKSYEAIVRTVMISVHCLHYLKNNLEEESEDALWEHIHRTFNTYVVAPDLVDHMEWIKEAAKRDNDISTAKILPTFVSAISNSKRIAFLEEKRIGKKPKCIAFEDDHNVEDSDDSSDTNKDELFDRVCAFCDDGGELLCCEGRCMRSFHPTIESGAGSVCESLGYNTEEVDALRIFLCKNCQYQRHQCFICGRLGSSNKSSGAEVFPCVSAMCGHFYHPKCVSELLFQGDEKQAQQLLQKQIEAGNSFTCPAHKCHVCKKGEDRTAQFAVCRRCPKAYHRHCLPRNISFECNYAERILQRAWENLLANKILIYCMDHKINLKVLTPRRDHLLFPDAAMKERRSKTFGILPDADKLSTGMTGNYSIKQSDKTFAPKVSRRSIESSKNVSSSMMARTNLIRGSGSTRNAEMEKRIKALMESCETSDDMEAILEKQGRRQCTQDKTITLGKVECSVQAIQAALKILQHGGSIEDANAICTPAVLTQMLKWKKQLRVYLAPFIHGMRYTSFGRHFTKVDKLKQVVDRLSWYVQDGDTIVDFCCGSNDFSCLMREELDRIGKICFFKNFDLIQPKNDFNFEKRDWMSVLLEELPEGSNLIMGLNPPFGVQAFHANQFIDKALTFRPKLLILIVPKETERLDRKRTPYDLIWRDDDIFSGKAFYLPGSIDVHDKQIQQWNLDPPPLYLWSRPDWTNKHKLVATQRGHITKFEDTRYSGVYNYLMEENQDCYGDFSSVAEGYGDINSMLDDLPDASDDI